MPELPPASRSSANVAKVPSRAYTFVTTLLATFVIGLTVVSLRPVTPSSTTPARRGGDPNDMTAEVVNLSASHDQTDAEISAQELKQLAGIAFGVALLSLIPSRRSPDKSDTLTQQLVAHSTGLTVLANLFPGSPAKSAAKTRTSDRLIKGFVSLTELTLIIAFTLSLAACLTQPELVSVFRRNPIVGYAEAVRFLADTLQGWLPAKAPLA